MADPSSSAKAEPAQTAAHGINKDNISTESVPSQTVTAKQQATAPQREERSSVKVAGSARKQTRAPPTFNVVTEDNVREMMNNARKLLHEKENPTKADEDFNDTALLITNLVQLMNASFIATDTIVRAIAYMRGDSQLSARSAIFQARRDRRALKAAEQPLDDVKNSTLNPAPPSGGEAKAKDTVSNGKPTSSNTKASTDVGPNQENTAPGNEDRQHDSQSLQTKTNKKKKKRSYRRSMRNQKDGANPEAQETTANVTNSAVGVADGSKDIVHKKTTAAEHKPEVSGEETAVEGDGVVVAVKG